MSVTLQGGVRAGVTLGGQNWPKKRYVIVERLPRLKTTSLIFDATQVSYVSNGLNEPFVKRRGLTSIDKYKI